MIYPKGQRLCYSLSPAASATLFFRMIQPPTQEEQSNIPRTHPTLPLPEACSSIFWSPVDRADPPRNHTLLTSNSLCAEKEMKTPQTT